MNIEGSTVGGKTHDSQKQPASKESSKKDYIASWQQVSGNTKTTYTKYQQYGKTHVEKKVEKIPAPEKVQAPQKPAPVKETPKKTTVAPTKKTTTPVVQKTPAPVPKAAPKVTTVPPPVTKTSSVVSQPKPTPPVEPDSFEFRPQPERTVINIPSAPPSPRPEPTFNFESRVSVTKYEYMYGIKHLEMKHKQYDTVSAYVSTPISVEGNVMQVALHAIEEHPLFDELSGEASGRQTSIEYYVTASQNPTPEDWFPILPESIKTVKGELLIFDTVRTGKLRFPAMIGSKEKPVMYRNGLKMEEHEWSFVDGATSIQLLNAKDPTAIYTMDYTPNSEFYNPWYIDVNQRGAQPKKHVQQFPNGTNHNKTVVLEKYPYVNYELINTTNGYDQNLNDYKPLQVRLKNAGIIGPNRTTFKEVLPSDGTDIQSVFTKNITDYKTGIHQALKPYSIDPDKAYKGFEYYQEGNKLYFSETFNKADIFTNEKESHGNAMIEVEYEYLASNFRVKIILRRNTVDENTLTPVVHEYSLKFKVMK